MTPLLLAPLELVYGSVVRARNARFDRIPAQRLSRPVVSIGNLSLGGAGKTPLVICLAKLLEREGWKSRRFVPWLWPGNAGCGARGYRGECGAIRG